MSRILIIEDALKDMNGHWFNQISCIFKSAKKTGIDLDIACHVLVIPEIRDQIKCIPTFKHSFFLETSKSIGLKQKILNYTKFHYSNFLSLWRLLKANEKYDTIFLPTCTIHHAIHLFIIAILHPNKPHKIVPLFLNPPGIWDDKSKKIQYKRNSLFFKLITKLLCTSTRFVLAVQTDIAKRELEMYTGCTYTVLPQPIEIEDNIEVTKTISVKQEISFGSFGIERYEKGTDIILKTASKIINKNTNISIKIQWISGFVNPYGDMIEMPDELIRNPRVIIYPQPLHKEYLKELTQTDCLILPYRNSSYYFRDSRVALEAAIYGIPIIYTKGGWLEEFANTFAAGIGIEEDNIESLSNSIEQMQRHYTYYKEIAQTTKSKTQAFFSASAFLERLIHL
jgi:glycosyltransferase involved in cell wall biosynthesis